MQSKKNKGICYTNSDMYNLLNNLNLNFEYKKYILNHLYFDRYISICTLVCPYNNKYNILHNFMIAIKS